MKTAIDKNGILHIRPENETEEYALGQWSEDFFKLHPNGLHNLHIAIHCPRHFDDIIKAKITKAKEDSSKNYSAGIEFEEVK